MAFAFLLEGKSCGDIVRSFKQVKQVEKLYIGVKLSGSKGYTSRSTLTGFGGAQIDFGTCKTAEGAARLHDRAIIAFGKKNPKLNFNLDEYASERVELSQFKSPEQIEVVTSTCN